MRLSAPLRSKQARHWLLCLLLPALLLAQWVGLSHKLSHFGWAGGKTRISISAENPVFSFWQSGQADNDESVLHSCALFDATVSADYLQAVIPALPAVSKARFDAVSESFLVWLAELIPAFAPRAPPLF